MVGNEDVVYIKVQYSVPCQLILSTSALRVSQYRENPSGECTPVMRVPQRVLRVPQIYIPGTVNTDTINIVSTLNISVLRYTIGIEVSSIEVSQY